MCGIFGGLSLGNVPIFEEVKTLAKLAEQRGRDSSGLVIVRKNICSVVKADLPVSKLLSKVDILEAEFVAGHSRLVTNGVVDNQPVLRDDMITLHNGIVCNVDELWSKRKATRQYTIDSEIIPAIVMEERDKDCSLDEVADHLFAECEGVVSAAIYIPKEGLLWLFSNNGSLYAGEKEGCFFFSSESYPLTSIGCKKITQIKKVLEIKVPVCEGKVSQREVASKHRPNLLPQVLPSVAEEKMLEYPTPDLKRCTKCILPETMPYIRFDNEGVCNYCENYTTRNHPKPAEMLLDLVEPYRGKGKPDCIVPFSGGRDSCHSLHLIVKELGMNPIAYTYDWGMVTDLGRRNISRMCAAMGVENIIIAPDIELKRRNIHKNLAAWLKKPHLGMISLLTAGDKHFFRHVETVKKQTGVSLNLWGINPLEVTHFKTGFLGIPPSFVGKSVYKHGVLGQVNYHSKRLGQMIRNPSYFNSSLGDTLSGEYWRSIHKKTDYFHVYDFYEWNEQVVDDVLAEYQWEWAKDTKTSWRIGDATAALYNYIYYTVAGFTEHDTFRSNQIREGAISRDEALQLVREENQPRYEGIKWYLQAVGIDYEDAIKIINQIPRLY